MRNPATIAPSDAVQALLDSIPEGPAWNNGNPVNNWYAAAEAVETANELTVRAALERLLALELVRRQNKYPPVMARNVKVNDHLLLGGIVHIVTDKVARGDEGQTIYIKARLAHLEDSEPRTFINNWDVDIPLVARPVEA